MDIQDILKKDWKDTPALEALADRVGASLAASDVTEPLGTGKLIARLLPGHTAKEYTILANLLTAMRNRVPGVDRLWAPTGKKNRYGKPALHWLPQV